MSEIRRNNPRGIAWMVLGVGTLALMDAGLKLLSPHYPAMQIAALRGLSAMPIVIAWIAWHRRFHTLVGVQWWIQIGRGLLGIFMLSAFTYALKRMPLSEAYVLFFVAPLVITALSVPLLGERVEARRWLAIGIGLVGVLIALRPTGEGVLSLAGLAVLAAAVCYALGSIGARYASRTDSTESLMFYATGVMGVGAALFAWPDWVPLRAADTWVIAGVAVSGAIGQYALTEAFRWGEASVVAPFEYSALGWGLVLDLMLWHVLPPPIVYAGAAIIVASGIYLARREHAEHASSEHP